LDNFGKIWATFGQIWAKVIKIWAKSKSCIPKNTRSSTVMHKFGSKQNNDDLILYINQSLINFNRYQLIYYMRIVRLKPGLGIRSRSRSARSYMI